MYTKRLRSVFAIAASGVMLTSAAVALALTAAAMPGPGTTSRLSARQQEP